MSYIPLPQNVAGDAVLVEQKSGTSSTVDDGGGTLTVDDGGTSLTVDGEVTSNINVGGSPVTTLNPVPVASTTTFDFFFEVSKGNVAGHSALIRFARIPATTGGSAQDDIAPFVLTYLTTASTIRIKAGGNAADTAAGTGAQSITVTGLDENYLPVTDVIATAGASASTATTNTYLRVHSCYVTLVGSGEVNAAGITIEAVTGGTTQALIPAGEGQTEQMYNTIPAGKTGYIEEARISLIDQEGGATVQHVGHFKGWIRIYNESSNNNYESWRDIFDSGLDTDGTNNATIPQRISDPLPEKTDIKMTVATHSANAEADARLFLILVDN